MREIKRIQLKNYTWSEIHSMMMEYAVVWPYAAGFKRSHENYGSVENDIDYEPGLYYITTKYDKYGSFIEVKEDNPKVVWHVDVTKFLMDMGRIE